MGEKIFKTGIKRDNDLMYYIKGGDVWATPRKKPGKPAMTGVVNVNRATEAELRLLPGIGKRRAQLIVERRDRKPFASLDEIGRIKGMRALVQRLRARLAVQGDTTLRPLRIDRNPRPE